MIKWNKQQRTLETSSGLSRGSVVALLLGLGYYFRPFKVSLAWRLWLFTCWDQCWRSRTITPNPHSPDLAQWMGLWRLTTHSIKYEQSELSKDGWFTLGSTNFHLSLYHFLFIFKSLEVDSHFCPNAWSCVILTMQTAPPHPLGWREGARGDWLLFFSGSSMKIKPLDWQVWNRCICKKFWAWKNRPTLMAGKKKIKATLQHRKNLTSHKYKGGGPAWGRVKSLSWEYFPAPVHDV